MVSKYRDILEPPIEQHTPDQVIEKYPDNEKGLNPFELFVIEMRILIKICFTDDREDYEDSAEMCPETQIDSSGPPSLKVE